MPSPTSIGRQAEEVASQYLQSKGYQVLHRNWRTRWCEIDVIVQQAQRVTFVEVKYRTASTWGGGLDYITSKKLQQMQLAAEHWIAAQQWTGDYALGALEVSGPKFVVTAWLPELW